MKASKKILVLAIILVTFSCNLLLADTGWYISQENNARGLTIPAYMTEKPDNIILLDGSIINLTGQSFSPALEIKPGEFSDFSDYAAAIRKNMMNVEITTADQDGWQAILTNSRIDRESLLYHLITSTFEENDINFAPKGAKKVNVILDQEKVYSPGKYGVRIAIVPNEQKRGDSQKITQKTESGTVTTTTVSDREANVFVK